MEKYTGISPLVADTMAIDSYPLAMDVPQLQRVPDSMFEFGLTPGAKSAVPDNQRWSSPSRA